MYLSHFYVKVMMLILLCLTYKHLRKTSNTDNSELNVVTLTKGLQKNEACAYEASFSQISTTEVVNVICRFSSKNSGQMLHVCRFQLLKCENFLHLCYICNSLLITFWILNFWWEKTRHLKTAHQTLWSWHRVIDISLTRWLKLS